MRASFSFTLVHVSEATAQRSGRRLARVTPVKGDL